MEHDEQAGMGMTTARWPTATWRTLAPGDTQTVEVAFDEPATILYGCDEVGHCDRHYDQGMVGTITLA